MNSQPTSTVPSLPLGGVVAVRMVSEMTAKGARVPLKVTWSVEARPVPVMVTSVPPVAGPVLGLTPVTVDGSR